MNKKKPLNQIKPQNKEALVLSMAKKAVRAVLKLVKLLKENILEENIKKIKFKAVELELRIYILRLLKC